MITDDLSKKLVSIEEGIKQFKTSQAIGQASNKLVRVGRFEDFAASSLTFTSLWWVTVKFTSDGVISPIVMPRATVKFNGSVIEGAIIYDRYWVLGNYINQTAFTNPYLTGFQIEDYDRDYTHQNGSIVITGDIYANCYGLLEITNGTY